MEIKVGDTVKLKNIQNDSIYTILRIFNNAIGQEWAACENNETGERPDHPISELTKYK